MNLELLANHRLKPELPSHLLLQWHITDRCNLRCSHCYQETYSGEELSFEKLLLVVDQFKELLKCRKKEIGIPQRGHITVTGGEPFIRKDFMELLDVFSKNQFSFAVLTNGSFIDKDMASHLARLRPRFVQVSIEGVKGTHDSIRGEGNFETTVTALKHLVKEKVPSMISFTAHKGNYREFPQVATLGCKLGVSKVWADRLIPNGNGSKVQCMSPDETREFMEIMHEARTRAQKKMFNKTEISMRRALQFLVAGGRPYSCSAGNTLITIMPNGDLYPCRRMPIHVGNVLETPLRKLYYENELMLSLRQKDRVSEGCENCFYSRICRGGLKCLSYAVNDDPFTKDPGCWRVEECNDKRQRIAISSSEI